MIAARAVPVAGQLVSVGGTGAVVTPLPDCVVPEVTEALLVGVFPVVLVLLPPEPQAARRKTRQQPRIVDKKERERTRYIHYLPG